MGVGLKLAPLQVHVPNLKTLVLDELKKGSEG